MQLTPRQAQIIDIVSKDAPCGIAHIHKQLKETISIPTLNRDIAALVKAHYLLKEGRGRATHYLIAPFYQLFGPIADESYFDTDPDNRSAQEAFNHSIFTLLKGLDILTKEERDGLEQLRQEYQHNLTDFPPDLYQKELERLSIELSWKSSQIEGNTYSLLETERLFKERMPAKGKPKEDAIMLLNHKDALHYLLEHKDLASTLTLRTLEEVHSILIKDLGVGRNIRTRGVGVTGTAYKPLDNAHQIRENLQRMCELINTKQNSFEKALLAIVLISYIQPFEDGNKRTGRMIGNALLIAHDACPLSYRSVDSIDYKKAMLLFYEQNNLAAFKQLFIEQNRFGVKNYFR